MQDTTVTGLVADRVRRLRTAKGWSAQRLADECTQAGLPLTRGTVAKIETGVRKYLTADEVAVLARVLGVRESELLAGAVDSSMRDTVVTVLVEAGLGDPLRLLVDLTSDALGRPLAVPDRLDHREALIELVNVCARTDGGMAALVDAVRMLRPASREYELLRGAVSAMTLVPGEGLNRLRGLLSGVTTPELASVTAQAVGHQVPLERDADAWAAFVVLSEFAAPEDSLPPALAFLEFLAGHVDDDLAAALRDWNDVQARRLGLESALPVRTTGRRRTGDARLYLMIAIEPDAVDRDRYLVSEWRQERPEEWPPPRGGPHTVERSNLEHHVDRLIVEAERSWANLDSQVAVEFVLPRSLLDLPIHEWCKEHDSGHPRPLNLDYPIVVRSLERMRASHWHRVWRRRWDMLKSHPSADHVYAGSREQAANVEQVLSDARWTSMVLSRPPSSEPEPGGDELTAALRAGLPAVVWHRGGASVEDAREAIGRLTEDDGLLALPERLHTAQLAARQGEVAPGLVLLWDDPTRLVSFAPAEPSPPRDDHVTVVALDAEGFTDPMRTRPHLAAVREGLFKVVRTAFDESGIYWNECRVEDRGDGMFIMAKPEFPTSWFADRLPDRLLAGLRLHNATHVFEAQLRVRLAVTSGEVLVDQNGFAGAALVTAFRLLEAKDAKGADAALTVVASDSFYRDAIRARADANPEAYRPISVTAMKTQLSAWVRRLGEVGSTKSGFLAVAEAMLAIPAVRDASVRLRLFTMLRPEIAQAVPHHSQDRLQIIALLRACERHEGGLTELVEMIRLIEGDTDSVRRLDELVRARPTERSAG
ncbi:Helix-turn-helix domain-containing protein [Amycolatopsis xylanica]|uniref:Helix-turn-helix domain-containing protein n=2 Tax=Amycolatopsis xylanica TaxID=589385 RepID=A0A1H3HI70_9PSEU|nr:Helix-turn-helix domain-containing protein [Amycolatopsis xylanica]